ncbi:MAG: helix-turn-helix transcriptional regulator [Prevotella sp.]|nr:helix-turn-helix transcriptional regulator [Prevotella sp.]
MYRLKEFLRTVMGLQSEDISSDEIYCTEADLQRTLQTNNVHESVAVYAYTLVRRGWLNIIYNDKELTLRPGDLYIYSPGFHVSVIGGSEDYHGICLMADEQLTLELPQLWSIIRAMYFPISELGQPVVSLTTLQSNHLWNRMCEITAYLHSSHRFLKESLRSLYTLFVLDMRSMMEKTIGPRWYSERTAEIFIGFMQLLPRNFREHHDIAFYADKLNVTTTHLSRIVRQVTKRTVMDYINQMLLMEALWLLQTTNLSMTDIAERLNFSNPSSFCHFFTRLKGIGPKTYRMESRMH